MEIKCSNCIFFDIIANSGDLLTYRDPHGNERARLREESISICRALPPTNEWPAVEPNDWCGSFNPGEEVSE